MKRIFDIIRAAAILMVLSMSASCLKVDILMPVMEDGQVSLTLKCSDIAQTRATATEAGDDAYNENDIHTLDIFFYPSTADVNTAAIHHMRLENLQGTGSYTYNQRIETSVIETIFGTLGTTAKIYAIANLKSDNSVALSSTATVNQLKSTVIATAAFAGTVAQDDFVMDSVGDSADDDDLIDDFVTYDSNTRSISGTINLYRAASKIGLFITSVTNVPVTDADGNPVVDAEGNPVMWVANTDRMLVRLNNGVKKTRIDADYTVQTADYFNFESGQDRKMQKPEGKSFWQQDIPFYSYPSNWSESGSDEEAYLTLIVPWVKSNDPNKSYPTYYQVPVNGLTQQLSRNSYYKINLEVSRLGTFTEGALTTITPGSYLILDWTTNTIDADMLDYRYLVVDQKEYTIYNQEEFYIPFRSSHETEIVSVEFKQQDLSNKYASDETWNVITEGSAKYFNNLDIKDGQIYYKNDLDNVYISNTFDFTPYKLTFRIRHKETQYQTVYYEDITIIQYPAIYGVPYTNSDWENSNTPGASSNNDKRGYVFVNGYNDGINRDTQDFFCSAPGFGNTTGSPNMFVFNITSVAGTDYVVGDPRENAVDNDFINETHTLNGTRYSIWDTAPALYDGETDRTLKYYYATDVDYTSSETMMNSRTRNMIAPQFRIASAYGVLQPDATEAKNLEYLKKRCASYQEDGYPAGRWRLPTEAEFRFIISQVNKNPATLPALYITNKNYWCAHGLGTVNGATVTMTYTTKSDGNSTRCVYDTWYWGNEPIDDPSVFTWGDMPR